MEPKQRVEVEDKGPPSPALVLLFSLFGYPGAGHFWVGSKKLGTVLALVFTALSLGVVYEMWVLGPPLFRLMTSGVPMEVSPNWPRIYFWVISTGVIWLGSGVHSYMLAKNFRKALQ